ncbi:putative ankyrin repeat-containing domain, PGG domain, ankyrin repeat-containing domain superfamily [Helianthus annuus]|nr:putative ankyrin repeat-containing domain, PGG domain, ankyrin repeat-containing domain superfamily [Helianthus annuus]
MYLSHTHTFSVKLSGNNNYHVWKSQMLCLLDSNNMGGIVDSTFVGPRNSDTNIVRQYDSLARGWILGSVSEGVLAVVHNLGSAKAVWDTLKSIYDLPICLQEDSTSKESDAETEKNVDRDSVSVETNTIEEDADSTKIVVTTETQTKNEDELESKKKIQHKNLREATINGVWFDTAILLDKDKDLATEPISDDGSTILHFTVAIGRNDFVKRLFRYINDEQVLKQRDSDGSTTLHIAAIVGNKQAADLLVKKNKKLLRIEDHKGELPLKKAYENMHLDTIEYLVKAIDDNKKLESLFSIPDEEIGVRLLVNAISAKHYSLASNLVQRLPKFASKGDDVLMALAKTFPSGLNFGEKFFYPSLDGIWKGMKYLAEAMTWIPNMVQLVIKRVLKNFKEADPMCNNCFLADICNFIIMFMILIAISSRWLIGWIILIIRFSFYLLCSLAKMLAVPPIKRIASKRKEWDEATTLLKLVCDEIDKSKHSGTHHHHYTQPILEAACQNAYAVVDEILYRSPEAIQSEDKSGHDIILLAIRNRSEKIYNLIYDIGERKNLYRMYKDSSGNNILHLAGKLAPSNVLNRRTGAALQLQRELQWHEEVKKLVFPTYITQENIFKETPDMVFTREHEKLVKEGEQWMKTTAESCNITAALITTIVFAAAITVPGGSNQNTGTPLFKKEPAFIIFAISDAISLFASSTSRLVFLSILTARFAEKDFLFSLPNRLFIGLFSLLLSTTAMMVAFSATLFLVFCNGKLRMLAPICVLAFIPITFFVGLQFPLMVDLFRSTYLNIFGRQIVTGILRSFNPDDIRLRFGIRN